MYLSATDFFAWFTLQIVIAGKGSWFSGMFSGLMLTIIGVIRHFAYTFKIKNAAQTSEQPNAASQKSLKNAHLSIRQNR